MHSDHPRKLLNTLTTFLTRPLDDVMAQHRDGDPRANAFGLFLHTLKDVPAYPRFLSDQGFAVESVKLPADFARLPLMNKANYMQVYSLPERCSRGDLSRCNRLAVSSGSTGTPTFWPRSVVHELEVAQRFEQVFRHSFSGHKRRTLAVVCFPLGNWVGGMYTASSCWHLATKGYPLLVATPGNKTDEILRVVRELAPEFDQTVLLGYPPYVKDVIDSGLSQGVDWSAYRIKLVFAGEVFSEEWRALIGERIGSTDPCYDSVSLYGTADGGVLGHETPLSIAIRRFLAQHPEAARELFGESRLPTLVQYDPMSRYLEVIDGTLAVTCDNGVPLVRYHIADRGGIASYEAMLAFLREHGCDALEEYGLRPGDNGYPLPFAWVFGRADFTVSFYGANIYPENVVVGLEQPEICRSVSGKFVMQTHSDADGSALLHIVVELLPGQEPGQVNGDAIADSIRREVLRLNSEFANYVPAARQTPQVELRAFADPEYFPAGIKHRYTRR
ncbi:phenylacetate--CoA ligase family protein [Methyloterricola oryzae]|uniref:phenylacetate--CoA ligase family protein n=1 Tax=Methyloterricola oryzae TaxID=1495050 RepID=UPI0005EB2389|nr:phenylacetate--CoA ligase family protein [Methyloterricola oryzae]